MKLKKLVKHFDFLTNAEIYLQGSGEPVWKGSMIYLHAAASPKAEYEEFLEDCYNDEDLKAAKKTKKARKLMDYELDTCADYEAIGVKHRVNKCGVTQYIIQISLVNKE